MKKIFYVCCFISIVLSGCAGGSSTVSTGAKLEPIDISEAVEAYTKQDCSKSIQLFLQASSRQKNPILLNGLGMSYLQCGQIEFAELTLKEAVSLSPNSAALQTNLGMAYFKANKIVEAKSAFKQALSLDPFLVEAVVGMANVYIAEGKPEQALKALFEYNKKFPDEPVVQYNQALAMYEMGMYTDSIKILENFVSQHSEDAEAYNALAVVYQKNGQLEKAKENIDKAISLYPVEGVYYYNKGNILRALNKFNDAEREYSRAISFMPTMPELYINRGDIRFLLRNTEEACADLKKACDLGSCTRLEIYQNAGRCLGSIWK